MDQPRGRSPVDNLTLVHRWIDAFRLGQREALEWILTRPYTYRVAGTRSEVPVREIPTFLDLSQAYARAFPGFTLEPEVIEEREHIVRMEARLKGAHAGPLDLRFLGLGYHPSTGRGLYLPVQRLEWDIVHERVHRFEVLEGPGMGADLVLEKLGLSVEDAVEAPHAEAEPALRITSDGPIDPEPEFARRIEHAVSKHRRRKIRERVWRN